MNPVVSHPEISRLLAVANDAVVAIDSQKVLAYSLGRHVQLGASPDVLALLMLPQGLDQMVLIDLPERRVRVLGQDAAFVQRVHQAMQGTQLQLVVEHDTQAFAQDLRDAYARVQATAVERAAKGSHSAVISKAAVLARPPVQLIASSMDLAPKGFLGFFSQGLVATVQHALSTVHHGIVMRMMKRLAAIREKVARIIAQEVIRSDLLKYDNAKAAILHESQRSAELKAEALVQSGRQQVMTVGVDGKTSVSSFRGANAGIQTLTKFSAGLDSTPAR